MRRARRHGRGAHLRRLLFGSFVAAILVAMVVSSVVMHTFGDRPPFVRDVELAKRFVAGRFDLVWDRPDARHELASALARDFDLGVRVYDARGGRLDEAGAFRSCHWIADVDVGPAAAPRGRVDVCVRRAGPRPIPVAHGVALFGVAFVLMGLAAFVARRIAKPLEQLTRVAQALGEGKLDTRAELRHRGRGEVGELGRAMNDMADRIERQVRGQRELLAAVSHELRTPLARMRLLVDLARDEGASDERMSAIEREIVETDALVADLLASSRVDFSALVRKRVELLSLAREALKRAALPSARLEHDGAPTEVEVDVTLVARAIAILLDNARNHGGAQVVVRVGRTNDRVSVVVEDDGPGFDPSDLPKVFLPFVRGRGEGPDERGGVGLGLSLVRRIAEAHGGRAFAENRDGGGARVGFELGRRTSVPPPR